MSTTIRFTAYGTSLLLLAMLAMPVHAVQVETPDQADPGKATTVASTESASWDNSPKIVRVRENLRTFAHGKLISMAKKLCFTSTNHCVERQNGKWVASYKDISPETLVVQVKPLAGKANNYIGLIRYAVLHYEATADTKVALVDQEFHVVKRLWQTEILRYDGAHWR